MFVFQGVTQANHLAAIARVFAIENPERVIVSVAFANEAGIRLVEDRLSDLSNHVRVIIGIRNGITSAQALRRCLKTDCELYAVDTGTRSTIFHPKIYYAKSAVEVRLLIGSANLTYGGLISNIEASVLLTLRLDNEDHRQIAEDIERKLDQLIEEFEDHAFEVSGIDIVQDLLEEGRITDETAKSPPTAVGSSSRRDTNQLPRMPLNVRHVPRVAQRPIAAPNEQSYRPTAHVGRATLVWQSSPLTRRDLNIPTSPNTSATGSMLFKKGASDIDQQTYFRQHVFDDLDWSSDRRTQGKELAEGVFQIIIGMVDFGEHTLTVTHDTRTDTKSFKQRQPMSALRWSVAKPIIAREDLLGRTLQLYRTGEKKFVIEID